MVVARGRVVGVTGGKVVGVTLRGTDGDVGDHHGALDVHVITAPTLRLDHAGDRDRLGATVAALRPRLLVLDPFVRLHRIHENVSGEVAPLIAYLRGLQRRYQVGVVVVHHARKGAARTAPARRCAAPPSFAPGATRTSTSAAWASSSRSPSSTAPPCRSRASRSPSRATATRSRSA